jgi:hypothetical protein
MSPWIYRPGELPAWISTGPGFQYRPVFQYRLVEATSQGGCSAWPGLRGSARWLAV